LPPFEAMDTCVCMGASIGVGLGLRHVLPPHQARKVVSVIGDSTFVHSGLTGLAEMAYNPPETGHVVIILDNHTTAMTGLQEHPGTGRRLDHHPSEHKMNYEALALAMGISNVYTIDPTEPDAGFEKLVQNCLESEQLTLIAARKPCPLASRHLAKFQAQCESAES
ncbi:MAG: thiamine pyrophosphate-dependent enzyme, partial [Candidatus Hydrogenedentota bacterium]